MSEAWSLDAGFSSVAIDDGSPGFQPDSGPVRIDETGVMAGRTNFPPDNRLSLAGDSGSSLAAIAPSGYHDSASSFVIGTPPIWINGPITINPGHTDFPLGVPVDSLMPTREFPAIDPRISLGWNDGLSQLLPLPSDGHISSTDVPAALASATLPSQKQGGRTRQCVGRDRYWCGLRRISPRRIFYNWQRANGFAVERRCRSVATAIMGNSGIRSKHKPRDERQFTATLPIFLASFFGGHTSYHPHR